MKKLSKYLLLVLVATMTFVGIKNVQAANQITITKKEYITTNFSNGSSRKEAKFTTSRGAGFCYTPEKTGGPQGTILNYSGTSYTSGSALYIFTKYNEGKTDYLTAQLAIWKVKSNFIPAAYNTDANLIKKVDALVTEAKNNSNYTHNPSVSLSEKSLTFTESGNNYVSQKIKITLKDSETATVKVKNAPSGTQVLDANGNAQNSFKNGATFYVNVPTTSIQKTENISVEVTTSGNIYSYDVFSGGKWQDIIVFVKTPKTATVGIEGTINYVEKHYCKNVDGKYYDKEGNETTKEKYQEECETNICKIVNGKYFDKEGKITTKEEYSVQCEKHTCEIVNGKYFDKEGNITDEATYTAQCVPVVPVPDTASSDNLVFTILGIMLLSGTAFGIKKLRA